MNFSFISKEKDNTVNVLVEDDGIGIGSKGTCLYDAYAW